MVVESKDWMGGAFCTSSGEQLNVINPSDKYEIGVLHLSGQAEVQTLRNLLSMLAMRGEIR